MTTILLPFHELSPVQLYDILRLRSEVFVVEQNCVFLDMDNKDQVAMHLMIYKNEKLVAYTRLFDKGQYYAETSIGRVVVCPSSRSLKIGQYVMIESIAAIKKIFNETTIRIGAQCYLLKFYQSFGFSVNGDLYVEDGIDHIEMLLE